MLFFEGLGRAVRGCAETGTCEEYIQSGTKWYAVVTNADIRAYAAAHALGRFPGIAACRFAFVNAETGGLARRYDHDWTLERAKREFLAERRTLDD